MTFVHLCDGTYFERKEDNNVTTYYDYWNTAHLIPDEAINNVVEYDDWHALYLATNYNPLLLPPNFDFWVHDMWIAPNGDCYSGEGHIQAAYDIVDVVYGFSDNASRNPEYYLEQKGWMKLSAFSHEMRVQNEEQWVITTSQDYVLWKWCAIFGHTYPTLHIKYV